MDHADCSGHATLRWTQSDAVQNHEGSLSPAPLPRLRQRVPGARESPEGPAGATGRSLGRRGVAGRGGDLVGAVPICARHDARPRQPLRGCTSKTRKQQKPPIKAPDGAAAPAALLRCCALLPGAVGGSVRTTFKRPSQADHARGQRPFGCGHRTAAPRPGGPAVFHPAQRPPRRPLPPDGATDFLTNALVSRCTRHPAARPAGRTSGAGLPAGATLGHARPRHARPGRSKSVSTEKYGRGGGRYRSDIARQIISPGAFCIS